MTLVLLLVGTKKGLFIVESDAARQEWNVRGPFCETWPIQHAIADATTGAIYAAGGSPWFGPAIWKTTDTGESWSHSSAGLTFGEGAEPVTNAWSVASRDGVIYAGVEPAGLFKSTDGGVTWSHVAGLRAHPTCVQWQAGGAGLILHSIAADPDDEQRIWVGISSAGVFYTEDGGETWTPRNRGTRADFNPEDQRYPEFGQCVHSIVLAPGSPGRLYQQNHCGMYRSDDGGRVWTSIEAGLPSSFGFPAAVHPRDADTLYLLPLNGDIQGRFMPDAKAAVWRTRDGGASWTALRNGLPQKDAYFGVLRQALTTDRMEPAGVYFGTGGGALFASADEGESWSCVAQHLPAISSVETLVVES